LEVSNLWSPLKITAEFVTSAADAAGFPRDRLPQVAMVGRSNVGKSSLINALVGHRLARTSAAPGKTRLANIYRVARGGGQPLYLVDLPGYGYARAARPSTPPGATVSASKDRQGRDRPGDVESRQREAAREFAELTAAYFGQTQAGGWERPAVVAALALVDIRHPGLPIDLDAWRWLGTVVDRRELVATKADKLARGQRIRACRELESVYQHSVLPVSAVTGEGLDELWKLIDKLATLRHAQDPPRQAQGHLEHRRETNSSNSNSRRSSPPAGATAPRTPKSRRRT
jgi:GTP-binding protein